MDLKRTVAACALFIACLASAPGTDARGSDPPAVAGIIPTGFGEAVDRDIARVRAATARFKTADEAVPAGYAATTNCVAHPHHGVMGLHYKNASLRDGTLDVEHPEILLYERTPDGTLTLTGVEYVVPFSAWTGAEPPTLMMQTLKREETAGIWYLHAWIWKPNASGIFADWNPAAKC